MKVVRATISGVATITKIKQVVEIKADVSREGQNSMARSEKHSGQPTDDEKRREFLATVQRVDALLPEPVLKMITERVLRVLFMRNPGLKKTANAAKAMRAPGTTVQKNYQFAPGAFAECLRLHGLLTEQNDRATKLIAELRQARAELLAAEEKAKP